MIDQRLGAAIGEPMRTIRPNDSRPPRSEATGHGKIPEVARIGASFPIKATRMMIVIGHVTSDELKKRLRSDVNRNDLRRSLLLRNGFAVLFRRLDPDSYRFPGVGDRLFQGVTLRVTTRQRRDVHNESALLKVRREDDRISSHSRLLNASMVKPASFKI